jgi:hypothetical protein
MLQSQNPPRTTSHRTASEGGTAGAVQGDVGSGRVEHDGRKRVKRMGRKDKYYACMQVIAKKVKIGDL